MDTTRKSARKLLKIRTYLAADLPFFHNRFMGSRQKRIFMVRLTVGVKYPFFDDFPEDIANQTFILTWDFAHLRQVYGHDLLFSLQNLLNFCPTTSFLMSKINVRTMKGFPPAQDYCRSVFFVDDR